MRSFLPALVLAAVLAVQTDPARASLPSVTSGARPGPDVLYAPPPAAPQLENRNPRFNASPLLVCGTEAYVDGEYLYQDYLYDDYGSDTDGDGAYPLSPRVGDVEYPTNTARYGRNAADLVEFRIDVATDSVAYRVTLNTLLQADSTIVAIAFDTDLNALTGGTTLPRDPGAPFPGTDEVITVWGTGAEHSRWDGLAWVTTALPAPTVDLEANQITLIVLRSVSDPSGTWRTTVASGLYNTSTGGWLRPGTSASATTPGGAGPLDPTPSGIFNQAFRFDEPFTGVGPVGTQDVPPDTNQAAAIRNKTPTSYARNIDFGALDSATNSTTVPATGLQVRIFPSRLSFGEGQNVPAAQASTGAFPAYLGQLQPYSIYIPAGYAPSGPNPPGLVLALHSLNEHYWQHHGSIFHQQAGDQLNNIVATSLSRGKDGWYKDIAEYDVFEMWNDIARHFTLDPDRAAINGYSMGGYATYRLGTLYPDLFGKALSVVGPPGEGIWEPPLPPTGAPRGGTFPSPTGAAATLTNSWLENARNLPYMNIVGALDELVPYVGPEAQNLGRPDLGIDGFDQLGYRFQFISYPTVDHLLLATLGYDYPMGLTFLGDTSVDRNPAHVTFSYAPAADYPPPSIAPTAPLGLVHNHAYWVSDLDLLSTTAPAFPPGVAKGTIDAFSHAFGVGDPASSPGQQPGVGPQALAYTEFFRTWGAPPAIPVQNRLDVSLTNLESVTVDAQRAGLQLCQPITLSIDSTTASRLLLAGPITAQCVSGAGFEQSAGGVTILAPIGHSNVTLTSCAAVNVSPAAVVVRTTRQQQFTASVSGVSNTAVIWSVLEGPASGTINASGLYTAPAILPANRIVHIRATSVECGAVVGNALVQLRQNAGSN